jgi:hypothetical protein
VSSTRSAGGVECEVTGGWCGGEMRWPPGPQSAQIRGLNGGDMRLTHNCRRRGGQWGSPVGALPSWRADDDDDA